ncbi:hypothetical protein BJ742DRAFT_870859 [Cladochytrium replicatum]|nr:hypothetical protein BJ742DRAFT_870859 [Cladochytrium replicatum]
MDTLACLHRNTTPSTVRTVLVSRILTARRQEHIATNVFLSAAPRSARLGRAVYTRTRVRAALQSKSVTRLLPGHRPHLNAQLVTNSQTMTTVVGAVVNLVTMTRVAIAVIGRASAATDEEQDPAGSDARDEDQDPADSEAPDEGQDPPDSNEDPDPADSESPDEDSDPDDSEAPDEDPDPADSGAPDEDPDPTEGESDERSEEDPNSDD